AAATGADVDVIIDDETVQRATHLGARSVHVFRIAQEAMTNATKHGGADHVLVTLRADDHGAVLSVVDNGRGFGVADSGERSVVADVDGGGVGLVGMRQRARMLDGSLTVGPRDDGKRGVAVILKLDPQTIGQPS
ncbi:MAG TPA: ATP-binding protein, partial [Myxococcota bacterium]